METLEFNVDASANNIRIDRYLADQCPEHSRSYIQKLLKEEQVLVNGRVIKANYKTQSGDYIEFHIPDPEVLDILPENIPLDILYEDDYVLVVNKPKDMVVHPSAGHTSGTLVNAVMAHCGEHLSGINGVLRPGIVPVSYTHLDVYKRQLLYSRCRTERFKRMRFYHKSSSTISGE